MRATASTSPFWRLAERIRRRGEGLEKRTWPMARARRWVGVLEVVEMRWISEVGVRWGREGGGGVEGEEEEGAVDMGDEGGGGVWGGVVEMERERDVWL